MNFRFLIPHIFLVQYCYAYQDLDVKYVANCTFSSATTTGAISFREKCNVALYSSSKNFQIAGKIDIQSEDFCSPVTSKGRNNHFNAKRIAVVKRGKCSFELKTYHATNNGYSAILIVNHDDDVFPPGGSGDLVDHAVLIPCIMIPSNFFDNLGNICIDNGNYCSDIDISLKYNNAPPVYFKDSAIRTVLLKTLGLSAVFGLLLMILCISSLYSSKHPAKSFKWLLCRLFEVIGSVLVVLLLLLLRVATFRMLTHTADGYGDRVFNHRETDERIFETLIHAVTDNWKDYTLHNKDITRHLQLASNYKDTIFIHPPNFVYFSAFLKVSLSLSSPFIALLFHMLTVLLMPLLLYFSEILVVSDPNLFSNFIGVTLWSIILLLTCPLCWFCSQKVWIDNALLFAVTLTVTLHLALIPPPSRNKQPSRYGGYHHIRLLWLWRHFLSGILFGLIAMNTKITALAVLPCLFSVTALRYFYSILPLTTEDRPHYGLIRLIGNLCSYILMFLLGMLLAHSPWIYLYWSHTHRWLPNAWPSHEMVARSSFLQAAVSKPIHYYLSMLLAFSPSHIVGLLIGLCSTVSSLFQLLLLIWRQDITRRTGNNESQNNTDTINSGSVGTSSHTSSSNSTANSPTTTTTTTITTTTTTTTIASTSQDRKSDNHNSIINHHPPLTVIPRELNIAVLFLWPLCFIAGFTLLGGSGAGYQSRFILPALPATALLTATSLSSNLLGASQAMLTVCAFFSCLVILASLHSIYYGILYSPLFADLDYSIWDILTGILSSEFYAPASQEEFDSILKYLQHFGLNKRSVG